MPHPLLIFNQSNCMIQVVDTNSYTEWQTMQIQISWLLHQLIWIYTVCKGKVYQGSAGLGLNVQIVNESINAGYKMIKDGPKKCCIQINLKRVPQHMFCCRNKNKRAMMALNCSPELKMLSSSLDWNHFSNFCTGA